MKKLLIMASLLIVGYVQAGQNVQASKEVSTQSVALSTLQGFAHNVKSFSEESLLAAESAISKNPKTAILVTVLATLLAEQIISLVYNGASDFEEEDEDLDIL